MREIDYQGSMEYFQCQLTKHGISKDELNMDNYAGLTARELQAIVNHAIAVKEHNND